MNLLIVYDYFYPGYRAGGPIQSLTNLALALHEKYDISVLTSSRDLDTSVPYKGCTINKWNRVQLPGSSRSINVFYSDRTSLNKSTVGELLSNLSPQVVYLNGIYSYKYFLLPLLAIKQLRKRPKVVICPRGMLQEGALAVKPIKKKLYLAYLRYSGILKNCYWHATSQEESVDIKRKFPQSRGITVASNIPKPPVSEAVPSLKQQGRLNLAYLSLITEKKNLLLLLQLIKLTRPGITLDIYGPIKDKEYWTKCESLIKQMPEKVAYKGDVLPVKVQGVLAAYHALILLTKGENFGHALYESLSVGRPVITSHFTPWIDLEQKAAGWNVDISDETLMLQLLQDLQYKDDKAWENYCRGAYQVAINYFSSLDTDAKYSLLFS